MIDYYSMIVRAISHLGSNTLEARQTLYESARAALLDKFGGMEALASSDLALAHERLALALAIIQVEKDTPTSQSPA
jgi:hypothetical protein